MTDEVLEEWDPDFLDEVLQVEERARTLSSSTQCPINPLIPLTTTQQQRQHHLSYSPPRQLSKRPNPVVVDHNVDRISNAVSLPQDDSKDREIERLKRELGHVSKQLSVLERECSELRNERNKKEEQIRYVYSRTLGNNDTDVCPLENTNINLWNGRECGVSNPNSHGLPQRSGIGKVLRNEIGYQMHLGTSSSKAVGVQTDKVSESSNLGLSTDQPSADLSDKLLDIWGSASERNSGSNLLSKLFIACPEDFQFLFGQMGTHISSKLQDSVAVKGSSNAALQCHLHSFHASEAAKVSHLYNVLTKVCNGLLKLDALLGPLIDLCYLENASSYSWLCSKYTTCVAEAPFQLLEETGKECTLLRDSVKVEGANFGSNLKERDLHSESEEASSATCWPLGTKFSDLQSLCKKRFWNVDTGLSLSCMDWVSLFGLLHQIALSKTEERVRSKAISIMNVILLRTNAHTERARFGHAPIFESISQFLRREAGSNVQKEALHLLFLLLNCPKLLNFFCSGVEEEVGAANDDTNASTSKVFSAALDGLADCIVCNANSIQDIELCKRAVIMLAFLASSGKPVFEILVNHNLPGERNFLMLILQLMSEVDVKMSISNDPAESIKARTLLLREALILLNRLVSNPGYSATVLQALTASRDITSMTIEVVCKLSREDRSLRFFDSVMQPVRESELVELARVLKKRVFTYLGDKIP